MREQHLSGIDTSVWIAVDKDNPVFREYIGTAGKPERTTSSTKDESFQSDRRMQGGIITSSSVSAPDLQANMRFDTLTMMLLANGIQADYDNPDINVSVTGTLEFTKATNKVGGADFTAVKAGTYFKLTIGTQDWVVQAAQDGVADGIVIHEGVIGADVASASGKAASTGWKSGNFRTQHIIQIRVNGLDTDGTTPKVFYRNFVGCETFSFALNAATESLATLATNLTGLELIKTGDSRLDADGKINGQTDAAQESKSAISTGLSMGAIYFNNTIAPCENTSVNLTFDNTGSEDKALFCEGASSISFADPTCTGSISTYIKKKNPFQYKDMLFENTDFAFDIMFKDNDVSVVFSWPRISYTNVSEPREKGPSISNGDVEAKDFMYIYMF